jgi:DivIVA domain-containing protein
MSTVEFTSEVVRNTKFRDKMRGYHPDEVDAFRERVATALDLLQERLAEITERAMKAEAALESNSETDESIRRTLTLAQRTAEMAVAEAREDADRIRAEATTEAERMRAEADDECRQRLAQAEESRQAAEAEATRLVEDAQREADAKLEASAAAIADAERASEERIAAAQADADESLAAQAAAARRDLDATVASLTAQRNELRSHVEALAVYLAGERGRVVESLQSALDRFSDTLANSEPTATVVAAMEASAEAAPMSPSAWPQWPAVEDPDEQPTPVDVWFPDEAQATAGEATDDLDAQPSSLLFRLEHEARRGEADGVEERSTDKPRKPMLGRRRS